MTNFALQSLDVFFFAFHSALILFNVFGWLVPRWRFLNLMALSLTAFSWFILGIWHGWGYCFCTEWHWQVRERIGYHDMSVSYIHFLLRKLTGVSLPVNWVDAGTAVGFFAAFFISAYLNIKKWMLK